MDSPLNEIETRFLLAEMIKSSPVHNASLVQFLTHAILDQGEQPNWLDMQVPRGRSLKECILMASQLFGREFAVPDVPPLKRKPPVEIHHPLEKRQAVMSPVQRPLRAAPASPGTSMAPMKMPPRPTVQIPHLISIQPRPAPAPASDEPSPTVASPMVPATTTPVSASARRPRGRPPRAQRAERVAQFQPNPPSDASTPLSPLLPPVGPSTLSNPAHAEASGPRYRKIIMGPPPLAAANESGPSSLSDLNRRPMPALAPRPSPLMASAPPPPPLPPAQPIPPALVSAEPPESLEPPASTPAAASLDAFTADHQSSHKSLMLYGQNRDSASPPESVGDGPAAASHQTF